MHHHHKAAASFSLVTCLIPIALLILAPIVLIVLLALSPYLCGIVLIGWTGIIIITALTNGLFGGQ